MSGFELVVVGTSLGGLQALSELLANLPSSFRLPLAIVQHRTRETNDLLRKLLQNGCRLKVQEATDKLTIQAGHVYVAPPDYHLLVEPGSFALSVEAPVAYSRPSIDVLFESAALSYGPQTIGVILTGANKDGAYGAVRIKKSGGWLIVQEPTSAESPTMPNATLAAIAPDQILPLSAIPAALIELAG